MHSERPKLYKILAFLSALGLISLNSLALCFLLCSVDCWNTQGHHRRLQSTLDILKSTFISTTVFIKAIRQGFPLSKITTDEIFYNTSFTLPKQSPKSRSVLQDRSRFLGLFWKGKNLFYNQRNTVLSGPRQFTL